MYVHTFLYNLQRICIFAVQEITRSRSQRIIQKDIGFIRLHYNSNVPRINPEIAMIQSNPAGGNTSVSYKREAKQKFVTIVPISNCGSALLAT